MEIGVAYIALKIVFRLCQMTLNWYAFRSKPNKEVFVYEQLLAHRIEAFLPLLRVHTVNPRARKWRPYFPGYLFLRADLAQTGFSLLSWMPGGLGIVHFAGEAIPVTEGLIGAIRSRVDEINRAGGEQLQKLKQGDLVTINSGPFTGHEAIFDVSISGNERVRVLLKLLYGKYLPVELATGFIQKKKQRA